MKLFPEPATSSNKTKPRSKKLNSKSSTFVLLPEKGVRAAAARESFLNGAAALNLMLPAANARRLVLLHDPVRRGAPAPTLTAVRLQARALAVHSLVIAAAPPLCHP
jgi:hypothetical protein